MKARWTALGSSPCAREAIVSLAAADDPTRRGDLIRLLATFPSGEAACGGMDADRLRTALGL